MKVLLILDRYSTGSTMRFVVVVTTPGDIGPLATVRPWAHREFPGWMSSLRTIRDDEPAGTFDGYQKVILP